jgi:hypothetical protein
MSERSDDAPKPGADDAAAERGGYEQRLDRRLDEALKETFPASDPIALTPRRGRSARTGGPGTARKPAPA